ncbi:CpaD family pilus assembly protein [Hyphococcus flavus]|uniref:CpaD family pilus assembly protein n=1 Tax=Hyphococcus flavus TaxID=1866326 RepID=A0AAE9ZEK6_9PROT|nr:CpaD family pilus assembly protein [Hyphococcus flavus]WDI33196.1 CpaD family pilus assembly protein [Hyphococcus flavus]
MTAKILKVTLLSAASFLAAGCAGGMFNGPEDAMTIAEAHPIAVDGQVVTLTISADPTTTDLSNLDRARLRSFVDSYLNNGHGPLTVTGPSGAGNDDDGHEASADIRKAMHDAGVPWSAIHGATYRTGDASSDDVIISFTRYVATPSPCGVWQGMRSRQYKNLRTPNMGCATMNNYAAMIADPHDLIAPAETDPRDGEAVVRAIELYRNGQVTASEVDGEIDAQTSGQN